MTRIISCFDNELWDLLSTGFDTGRAEHADVDSWSEKDWKETTETRVFVAREAVYAVAQGIREGLSVSEAEQQWLQATKALLQGQSHNRRLNKLVLLDDAAANPEDFANNLTDLKIKFEPTAAQSPTQDVALLAAQASISQSSELLDLNNKLVVSALPILPALAQTPVDQIVSNVMLASREISALKKELQNTQQEHEAQLQKQIRLEDEYTELKKQVTTGNDNAERANRALTAELTTLNQALEKSKSEQSQAETEHKTLAEENELLLLQLQQVQEKLEEYYLRSQSLENELSSATAQLEKARALKAKWSEMKTAMNAELKGLKVKIEQKNEKLHEFSQKRKREKELHAAELSDLNIKISSGQLEYNELKTEYESLSREADQIRESLLLVNQREEKQSEKLTELNQKIEQKNKKLHAFSQKMKHQDETNRNLTKALKEEQEQRSAEVRTLEAKVKLAQIELREAKASQQVPAVKTRTMRDYLAKVSRKKRSKQRESQVKRARERKHVGFIRESQWFDPVWYLTQYPDIAEAEIDPAEHYYYFGGFEGRNPGPDFDSQYYIDSHDDVSAQKINPLVHFILFGYQEGRLAKPALIELNNKSNTQSNPKSTG